MCFVWRKMSQQSQDYACATASLWLAGCPLAWSVDNVRPLSVRCLLGRGRMCIRICISNESSDVWYLRTRNRRRSLAASWWHEKFSASKDASKVHISLLTSNVDLFSACCLSHIWRSCVILSWSRLFCLFKVAISAIPFTKPGFRFTYNKMNTLTI